MSDRVKIPFLKVKKFGGCFFDFFKKKQFFGLKIF